MFGKKPKKPAQGHITKVNPDDYIQDEAGPCSIFIGRRGDNAENTIEYGHFEPGQTPDMREFVNDILNSNGRVVHIPSYTEINSRAGDLLINGTPVGRPPKNGRNKER